MGLRVTTAPVIEPVTSTEAKLHLHYDAADQDTRLTMLIAAAREACQVETNRALLTQTITLTMDDFPSGRDPIILPRAPLQSVTSIKYTDTAGTLITMAASDYQADIGDEPGRVFPARLTDWPSADSETPGAVTVVYVAGWATAAAVPAEIRQACLLLIGHWWDNLAAVVTGTIATEIPLAVKMLLTHQKVNAIA